MRDSQAGLGTICRLGHRLLEGGLLLLLKLLRVEYPQNVLSWSCGQVVEIGTCPIDYDVSGYVVQSLDNFDDSKGSFEFLLNLGLCQLSLLDINRVELLLRWLLLSKETTEDLIPFRGLSR